MPSPDPLEPAVLKNLPPRLLVEQRTDGVCAVLSGDWTAANLALSGHWKLVQADLRGVRNTRGVCNVHTWDLRLVPRLDHVGAQLLWNTWGRKWPAQLHILEQQRVMLERVARFSAPLPPPVPQTLWSRYLHLGRWVLGVARHVTDFVRLLGQLLLDVLLLVRTPHRGPWRDISGHVYRIGATAMPITALLGFLIGVVLAYLMSQQLRQFGADAFIVNILGLALIRELGPILAAVLIAGRSGSAITAQIGVMRVTEELDAMQVMGIAHGFRLVLPRAIAVVIAMPLLAVWTTLAALSGGMLASNLTMGLTPEYFVIALGRVVPLVNLWLALGKSVVFGLLIALIGCHYGLRVKPNTQSLSEGTTASVVTSITMVIVVDALSAVIFKSIGIV